MSNKHTVLVVDDETDFRENLAEFLKMKHHKVFQAGNAEEGWTLLQEKEFDVALVDLAMPGTSGLELLFRITESQISTEVIIVTAEGSIDSAVEAMRRGAFNYVAKPVRLHELELMVQRAGEKNSLKRENFTQRESLRLLGNRNKTQIIANSPKMKMLLKVASEIAATDATVLIQGETGVGKEIFAEFIHRSSKRGHQPLPVINCGALAENLIDAELFGYEKGAFTGATETRLGMIEVAHQSSLFLDELGEVPPPVQVRLLRFLENQKIRRIGATTEREVDVRVIAATHRDLEADVKAGRFREDLYHRVLVFQIEVPPLRERHEDIIPLAEHYISAAQHVESEQYELDDSARQALLGYPWPGNVRELAHTVERAAFSAKLSDQSVISASHLNLPSAEPPSASLDSLKEIEEAHVQKILSQMDGNRRKSAQVLGISERKLYRMIQNISSDSET